MAQRRHHYERAFECYVRTKRMPYVAVDEARKSLLPAGEGLEVATERAGEPRRAIKSFDFVLYADQRNLLVEVKGRKVIRRARPTVTTVPRVRRSLTARPAPAARRAGRLESWVTSGDVESLSAWETLFGEGFTGAFVFVYWCDEQPPDGLFQEVFAFEGRWYALRAVSVAEYARCMKRRSERWQTVDLARSDFERVSQPFSWSYLGAAPQEV